MHSEFQIPPGWGIVVGQAQAQATGNPGFNNLTVNALGAGTTSCTLLTFLAPATLNFEVTSDGGGYPVMIVGNLGPCCPNSLPRALMIHERHVRAPQVLVWLR